MRDSVPVYQTAGDGPLEMYIEHVERGKAMGIRAYPMCSPNRVTQDFTMKNSQVFRGLPTWHRWQELLDHCHLVVLQRPDADSEAPEALRNLLAARSVGDPQAFRGPAGQIAFAWQMPLAISATQIRERLASGRSIRFLVPDAVLAYIHAHGLYRATPSSQE